MISISPEFIYFALSGLILIATVMFDYYSSGFDRFFYIDFLNIYSTIILLYFNV